MVTPRRPWCTPPGAPRIPNVPVCRPLLRGGAGVTPFGGPASGISPAGGILSPAAAAAPGVIVGPTPTPPPTCMTATIFADCFGLCTGVINGASPGPICGWTFIEPFGALGGEFNFTPGVMSMDTAGAAENPTAAKPLPAPLVSVFNLSGQFDFTEYSTPPVATTAYNIDLNNSGITESFAVALFGDGNLAVQAGNSVLIPTYLGTWTPAAGASHVVHFTVDALGVPRLWIDEVEVPLVFFANVGTFFALFPDNSISYGGGAGDAAPAQAPLRNLFLTAGVVGPETEFCCPVGS